MRTFTTITVAKDTANQLRQIAKARGVSLADLIAGFVEAEIASGTIPDGIPGFAIKKNGHHVSVELKGLSITVTKSEIPEVVAGIEQVATKPYFTFIRDGKTQNFYGCYDFFPSVKSGTVLQAQRRGRGIVVILRDRRRSARKSLSPIQAVKLAQLLNSGGA